MVPPNVTSGDAKRSTNSSPIHLRRCLWDGMRLPLSAIKFEMLQFIRALHSFTPHVIGECRMDDAFDLPSLDTLHCRSLEVDYILDCLFDSLLLGGRLVVHLTECAAG